MAGHVDHGKTALVGALTGRDTDRLAEEKRRGVSIELGYAPLELPGGRRLSVVDVPGHERFVRTMVAGATGVDLFLLCVAADDGVMPQTLEHVAVLRALDVRRGVVAVTKADSGEPELAAAEAEELLPGVEVVAVSVLRRTGLGELLAALGRAAEGLPGRAGGGLARLHVDRSFTLKGPGTVVTGTLWSGELAAGETVTVLPRGQSARVRTVQVHDEPVERAVAGQRVALNLGGIGWRELRRGDVVCHPDALLAPTFLIDTAVTLEPGARALRRGARLAVHHGTREAPGRVVALGAADSDDATTPVDQIRPGTRSFCQLRLEAPLVPAAGDRFVLRQFAPPDTIGGGVVIDPSPRKHGPSEEIVERLRALERGEEPPAPAQPVPEPAPVSAPKPALDDDARRLAALLRDDGESPRADGDLAAALGLDAAAAGERLRALELAGEAVRVARNLHFHPEPLERLTSNAVAICERDGVVTIAGLRDELGTSRRYAQALLEHLDATKVTVRRGDAHVLRRRRHAS